jgi:hypothetical protein
VQRALAVAAMKEGANERHGLLEQVLGEVREPGAGARTANYPAAAKVIEKLLDIAAQWGNAWQSTTLSPG